MIIELNLAKSKICNYFPSRICTKCANLEHTLAITESDHLLRKMNVTLTPLQACWGLASQIFFDCPYHVQTYFVFRQQEFNR